MEQIPQAEAATTLARVCSIPSVTHSLEHGRCLCVTDIGSRHRTELIPEAREAILAIVLVIVIEIVIVTALAIVAFLFGGSSIAKP